MWIPTRVLFVYPYILRIASQHTHSMQAWLAVLPVACTHALGSALGELPPFLGSNMLVTRLELDTKDHAMARSHRWFLNRMQRHGWIWVFVLAAWPNVAFDMAGLAAGASGMSLLSFISAAVCGKAVVRAPIAAALLVGSAHSISWMPVFHVEQSSVSFAQGIWTVFVVCMSCLCLWWCAKEAAEEEHRRLQDEKKM